jgi:hypothetical protein
MAASGGLHPSVHVVIVSFVQEVTYYKGLSMTNSSASLCSGAKCLGIIATDRPVPNHTAP